MEIYGKKNLIEFTFSIVFALSVLGLSLAGLTILLNKDITDDSWLRIAICMFSYAILSVFSIIACLNCCAEYKHLVIDKKPAIIINDDSITYYAFYSRKYITFKLEDIKEFKLTVSKSARFIQPVFKNSELAKKYKYRTYLMHFTIVARINNLEDGYSNIIYILNHIIDGTYFEGIYKPVKERTI